MSKITPVDMMRVTLVTQLSAARGRLSPTGWTAVKPLVQQEVLEALAPKVGGWSPPRCLGGLAPYLLELDRDGRAEMVALLERRGAALVAAL